MRLRKGKPVAQLAKGSRIQIQPDLRLSPLCTLPGERDWGPSVGGGRGFQFKTKFVLNAGDQWAAAS